MRIHPQPIPHLPHPFSMIFVEGNTFLMGDEIGDLHAYCRPVHPVTVSPFYIGQFPVTQALWKAVTNGENPSRFPGDDRPVEQVSWNDAQAFLQKLNNLTSASRPEGYHYRLPTEAEWEYAARGGCYSLPTGEGWGGAGYQYAGSDRLKDVGWYDENSGSETKPVGLKYPNQLGLYDMSGNVWEWCEDDWHKNYKGAPKDGSAWVDKPERGPYRVLRGGVWGFAARSCRSASRDGSGPGNRGNRVGFRLALALQSVGRPPAFL